MQNSTALLYCGVALGSVFHELGHLICGRAVGIPVRLFSLGLGPVLFRWKIRETSFELRLVPISGFVQSYPVGSATKIEVFIFLMGGVVGNAVLAVILITLFHLLPLWKIRYDLSPMIVAQEFMFVGNLVPFTIPRGGKKVSSDGKKIFDLFRGKDVLAASLYGKAYAQVIATYTPNKKDLPSKTNSSARILYHLGVFLKPVNQRMRQEAFEVLMRELARDGLQPADELVILDTFLTRALIDLDETLLPFREKWAVRALALAPDIATIRGTCGSVFIDIGREIEGKALLQPLLKEFEDGSFAAVMIQLFLAKAYYKLGDLTDAADLLGKARIVIKFMPTDDRLQKVLTRIEADLASS